MVLCLIWPPFLFPIMESYMITSIVGPIVLLAIGVTLISRHLFPFYLILASVLLYISRKNIIAYSINPYKTYCNVFCSGSEIVGTTTMKIVSWSD